MKNSILIIGSDSFIAKIFISKYSENYLFTNISRIRNGIANEYISQNFNDLNTKLFKDIDVVLNFAAIVHHPEIKDEKIYDNVNHHITIQNALKAKQSGVKLFIQMSTIAVYGNIPYISTNTPYNPQSPYGKSKMNADKELLLLQDETFQIAIVRPPMVYGGGRAPGNMMRLIHLANMKIPIPFKGVQNKRDFINVHNLVQYLSISIEKQLSGILLIADNESVSTEYLLLTISKYLNKKIFLIKAPQFALHLLKIVLPKDYEKIFGTLKVETNFPYEGLINKHTVDQGIKEMIDWYKENNNR